MVEAGAEAEPPLTGQDSGSDDGKDKEKEANEIDWNWGEDSADFQPSKAGWVNLAVGVGR